MYKYSNVYFTKAVNSNGIMNIFQKVNKNNIIQGKAGIKIHSGEIGGYNYIKPELIKELVKAVNGIIIDANTPYAGNRNNNMGHWMTLREHGFTQIAECDLLDENDDAEINVENGNFIHKSYIGTHLLNYESILVVAHFKGHATCGYGGALKDYSIGLASLKGKCWIHTAGQSIDDIDYPTKQEAFFGAMVDSMIAMKQLNKRFIFINVMNNLSADGDGCPNPRLPEIDDIGILASTDPVALDKACIDMIYNFKGSKQNSLIERIEEKKSLYLVSLSYKQKIGNINYKLINIDENSCINGGI